MVNLEARTMTVTGKGRKMATIHLSAGLFAALSRVAPGERTGPVIPWRNAKTVRLVLRSLCLMVGVSYEKRQVHGLRHSCATLLLEDTKDLYLVARHMRHSSVSTTEVYAKVRSERLIEALRTWGEPAPERVTN